MKKLATSTVLTAALGLSVLAGAPAATAASPKSCAEVYAAGYYNVPQGHALYSANLDRNHDGVACETPGSQYGKLTNLLGGAPSAPSGTDAGLPDHVTLPDEVDEQFAYPDCKDVFAAGLANLPESSEYYHADLDADLDGIGCEANGDDAEVPAAIVAKYAPASEEKAEKPGAVEEKAEEPVAVVEEEKTEEEQQVTQVPAGAVDAGVAPESDPAAALAVGALGLAAVAGAGVVARRRSQA